MHFPFHNSFITTHLFLFLESFLKISNCVYGVVSVREYVHMSAVPIGTREGFSSPRPGVTGGLENPNGCWVLNWEE